MGHCASGRGIEVCRSSRDALWAGRYVVLEAANVKEGLQVIEAAGTRVDLVSAMCLCPK